MKIKVALIPHHNISTAQEIAIKLQDAMEAGKMNIVDQTTKVLLSLTDKDYSISLSEDAWYKLIEKVRSYDGDFKSDYVMSKPQLQTIIASGASESFADVASIFVHALRTNGMGLQLPFEEEDTSV